jgi:hypothetical protein
VEKRMMLQDRVFMKKLSGLALPIAAQSLMLSAVSVADRSIVPYLMVAGSTLVV